MASFLDVPQERGMRSSMLDLLVGLRALVSASQFRGRSNLEHNMLTINVTLSTLHVAIVGRLIELNADPAKVLSEVNAQLTALEVNADKSSASIAFSSSKGGAKEGPKMTVKSVDKRTSVKVSPTAGLRLAEINEYLNESAELYTRINSVTLPQSVETWASAERFALAEGEKEKILAALVKA